MREKLKINFLVAGKPKRGYFFVETLFGSASRDSYLFIFSASTINIVTIENW